MLLASIELLTAAIARWPVVMTAGALPSGGAPPATLWGGLVIVVERLGAHRRNPLTVAPARARFRLLSFGCLLLRWGQS
jgi:hypothetical protein